MFYTPLKFCVFTQ